MCVEAPGNITTLLYADDLAICTGNIDLVQNSINLLSSYCVNNGLAINVGKTKIFKFRRDWHLGARDSILCGPLNVEFVSEFVYLGVFLKLKVVVMDI